MLANRGYVVYEPNFRGSTGFGRAYMRAGKGDFGNGRVQQDIVEGVRFLAAQGIGDASRAGIVGASFGGYSALLGVTFQPELFRVGVAAVPPADLGWVLRWYSRTRRPDGAGHPDVDEHALARHGSRGSEGRCAPARAIADRACVAQVVAPGAVCSPAATTNACRSAACCITRRRCRRTART